MSTNITSALQPPPGPTNLVLPTASNPHPSQNPATFNDAFAVRRRVFIEEQNIAAEAEIDDDDARSWQWVLYTAKPDTNGTQAQANGSDCCSSNPAPEPVAVVRLVPPPHPPHESLTGPDKAASLPEFDLLHEPCIKLTRVAVVPEFRGTGLGRMLVDRALEWARRNAGEIDGSYAETVGQRPARPWSGLVLVHAQVDVEKMYQRLGFETDDALGRWDEEGIEHVGMWRRVKV
ncbi:hypothetical protein PHISP_00188 [Aspergillus sp. HF37]|nr:hypothetical protein PHISP_00188 [Aspergillus sp. HF37]